MFQTGKMYLLRSPETPIQVFEALVLVGGKWETTLEPPNFKPPIRGKLAPGTIETLKVS